MVPTSEGNAVAGTGSSVKPLPAAVTAKVTKEGGTDAPALTAIATSSTYGAPQESLPSQPSAATDDQPSGPTGKKPKPRARPPAPAASHTPAKSAAPVVTAGVSGGGSNRLPALLVMLGVVTAGLVFAGIRSRG
jgi:hypothetical protein